MLQDVDQKDEEAVELDTPTIKGTEQRSLDVVFDSQEMSECYVTQRKSSLHAVTIWTCRTGYELFMEANPITITCFIYQYNQYWISRLLVPSFSNVDYLFARNQHLIKT